MANGAKEDMMVANHQNVSDEELRRLVDDYAFKDYSALMVRVVRARELISQHFPPIPDLPVLRELERLRQRIKPNTEPREQSFRKMKGLLTSGRLCAFKLDGQAVGMVGISEVGTLVNGQQVCEITQASTLKQFRGKGVYTKLITFAEAKARELYPDACLMRITHIETVKRHCQRVGWELLNPNEQSDMAEFITNHPVFGSMARDGDQVYYRMTD